MSLIAALGLLSMGCATNLPVAGYASAACIPRPMLIGPVEKVGGGELTAASTRSMALPFGAELASKTRDVLTTQSSTSITVYTTETSTRYPLSELGVAVLVAMGGAPGEKTKLSHTEAIRVRELILESHTSDARLPNESHAIRSVWAKVKFDVVETKR